jgi:alpha-N-arabinofuranosidase
VIGDIDPKIYGNFIEHLGRCIEGGVFDEGSPLSDAGGFRRDVLDAAKKLNVTMLRWPGGNFSSNYNWMDGIGPRDQRPRRLEMAWGTVEDNRFGTHEFMEYVEKLGTEPYFCANLGIGSWQQAQQWVEYCNSSEDTAMTRLRKQNGRAQPWKVTYWGLGNEMDGPWQMGHRSADDYGKFALEAAKLMKWTDPGIKLIAAGSSNFGPNADWTGWNRTVLEHLKHHVDYLSLHMYVGNRQRFRRVYGQFRRARQPHQDRRGYRRCGALRRARQPPHLHCVGRVERLVSRARGGQGTGPPHPGGALQPGRRPGGGHLPQFTS